MIWRTHCHCGDVMLQLARPPDELAECNCSLCRTHGVIWSYFSPNDVEIVGETQLYARADRDDPAVHIHFCARCGCTTHWSWTESLIAKVPDFDRMGVNMRLFPPDRLSGLTLRFPDGRNWDGQGAWDHWRADEVMP